MGAEPSGCPLSNPQLVVIAAAQPAGSYHVSPAGSRPLACSGPQLPLGWPSGTLPGSRPGLEVNEPEHVADRVDLAVAAADHVGDHPGPAGLVEGAESRAVVAVEVLAEDQVVVPRGIGLQ